MNNLYLAHRPCNSSRGNMDFDAAQPLVEFRVYGDELGSITFDKILDRYVKGGRKDVSINLDTDRVTITFGSAEVSCPLFKDPATGVAYFFVDVPIDYVHNDKEVQPRLISYAHVRKLAVDFITHPVHEPSNCRLVSQGKTARLLQWDGQHKTTAQVLLGRKHIQFKVYVDPPIPMLQSLVVKIQQDIKKQPLTRSDTLAKLGDVIASILDEYKSPKDKPRTERGFIEKQPVERRAEIKKQYLSELERIVFFDDDNALTKWVKPGAANSPTTDKVVIDKIIRPLIYPGLLDADMDAGGGGRDNERKSILVVLNAIERKMLPVNWNADEKSVTFLRTRNFFYQGAIGWWLQHILAPALRYHLYRIGDKKPLFVEPLSQDEQAKVIEVVENLCDWEIWSTTENDQLKAMRSNTVESVKEAFPGYDDQRLIKESQ